MTLPVKGYCPMGCGETLVATSAGNVTCTWRACPDPNAVFDLLTVRAKESEHIVKFDDEGFSVQHPLREHGPGLFDCEVHKRLMRLDAPPRALGYYRVTLREHDPTSESFRSGDVGLDYEPVDRP